MSDPAIPLKNEALIRLRKSLKTCTVCGQVPTEINANSHKTAAEKSSVRFYFQFLHGEDECIDQVMAVDFDAWLQTKIAEQ